MNIPSCCKDNPYACIEIIIDNSFSNKILLCKKHYTLHMDYDNNSVSILGHILEKESKEVIKTTKHHSVPTSSLEKLPEELLSLQNIEEPMTVSLEKNNSSKLVITTVHELEGIIDNFLVLCSNKKMNFRHTKPVIHVCGTIQFDFENLESITKLEGVSFD